MPTSAASTNPTGQRVTAFFDRYAAALLARDEQAMAELYAVPSLILFPSRGNVIAVTDPAQTAQFFAASWAQYEGVDEMDRTETIMGEAPHSIWVDVTWTYGGKAQERFCYQLLAGEDGDQIAVLTPLALPSWR